MAKGRVRAGRTIVAGLFAVSSLMLAGCSAESNPPDEGGDVQGGDAARFVACLTAQGVEARIGDSGLVFVAASDEDRGGTGGAGSSGGQPLMFETGDDGRFWVAANDSSYFAPDPQTQQAYASCEAELPGFSQPSPSGGAPQLQEGTGDQSNDLVFAQCARDAGFSWVADPSPTTGGGIQLPLDITEDEFRALLSACFDKDSPWISWRFKGELSFDYMAVLNEFTGVPDADYAPAGGDQ